MMKMIPEDAIDRIVEELNESDAVFEAAIAGLQTQQPVIISYLFSENFEAFTQEEREFTLFLVLVVWMAVTHVYGTVNRVSEEKLGEAEEKNWDLLQQSPGGTLRSKFDLFFYYYPQEDLLAFVEDALVEDEEEETGVVTKEGREYIFITLKTIIDCLSDS
jgi:hypothetical protein